MENEFNLVSQFLNKLHKRQIARAEKELASPIKIRRMRVVSFTPLIEAIKTVKEIPKEFYNHDGLNSFIARN